MPKLKSHKTVEQIAKKHRLDVSFIQKQLDIGEPIEHEHTKDHELAQESDMPRAYEVAGQLMKNAGEIADKILLVHKILKDVEEDKPKGPTTVNNALFVGSTAELAKLLKQQSENENV